ncbi:MAG: anaerobic ribonucleoside-triphosphate reductase activating protein [Alphaproteobacteria bacterium]|nr:anaerobic ribonucleoside-triphosphate reductase activating protein [Alphaproteobacteria bacterium]
MREIQIGGLVPFTTIDYPGKLSAVLFLVGCPLRCAYCSNPHLLSVGDGEYDPERMFEWLKQRIGKLEAIVFSGGEALMQGGVVIEYMRRVKELGFKIGLHTNGFYPELLKQASDVVDWIGLDFKATREKYPDLTGQHIAYDNMIRSLDVWLDTGKEFEVRITCDPRYVSVPDLYDIADVLSGRGVKNIAIQKYIAHFEDEENKTTDAMRNQFFVDYDLREALKSMFETVTWRE